MVSEVKGELGFCPGHLAGGGVLPNTGATRFLAKPSRRRSKASAPKEIGGERVSPRDSEFGETLGVGRTLARVDTWFGRKSAGDPHAPTEPDKHNRRKQRKREGRLAEIDN